MVNPAVFLLGFLVPTPHVFLSPPFVEYCLCKQRLYDPKSPSG